MEQGDVAMAQIPQPALLSTVVGAKPFKAIFILHRCSHYFCYQGQGFTGGYRIFHGL